MGDLGEKLWCLTMSMTIDTVTAKQGLREAITGATRLGWRTLLLPALEDARISLEEESGSVQNSRRMEGKVMKILTYHDKNMCPYLE